MDKKIIKINENGNIIDVEVIAFLQSDDGKKQYVLYTQNEKDVNGMNILYFSELIEKSNNEYVLEAIKTDEEMNELKEIIRKNFNDVEVY